MHTPKTDAAGKKIPGLRTAIALLLIVLSFVGLRRFVGTGWPLESVQTWALALSSALILFTYIVRSFGWTLLFPKEERPSMIGLIAATAAASAAGNVLPSQISWLAKVALLKRIERKPPATTAIGMSLIGLGLLEVAGFTPMCLILLPFVHDIGLQIPLVIVAVGGVACFVFYLCCGRIFHSGVFSRWPRVHGFVKHCADSVMPFKTALAATAWIAACSLVRAAATCVLFSGMGLGLNPLAAMIFICTSPFQTMANSTPMSGAARVAASTAMLGLLGMSVKHAADAAVATSALAMLASLAICAGAVAWKKRLAIVAMLQPARA